MGLFDLYTAEDCITGLILMITAADVVTNGGPASLVGLHTVTKAVEFSLAPAIGASAAITNIVCGGKAYQSCVDRGLAWILLQTDAVLHRNKTQKVGGQ